ncbi:MAG: hypothetical protein GX046_06830 [Tissierellia bacterium]|nr:hypothetical protein [Tissierellia bacterium]
MYNRQRGSLSLEAGLVMAIFLVLLMLFYGVVYGYRSQKIAFEVATLFVLEKNTEVLTEKDFDRKLNSPLIKVEKGYVFKAMNRLEEEFSYNVNGFSYPLEEVVFITDYGKMYHLPGCPTVKKSLRPVIKKDVPHLTPCSLCHK